MTVEEMRKEIHEMCNKQPRCDKCVLQYTRSCLGLTDSETKENYKLITGKPAESQVERMELMDELEALKRENEALKRFIVNLIIAANS